MIVDDRRLDSFTFGRIVNRIAKKTLVPSPFHSSLDLFSKVGSGKIGTSGQDVIEPFTDAPVISSLLVEHQSRFLVTSQSFFTAAS